MQPFPAADHERENRIVQDVADLLHEPQPSDETTRKIKRWIQHVLSLAAQDRKWWFLENVATVTLEPGQDIIDFTGHIDKVVAAYGPKRLNKLSLAAITALRMDAEANSLPNAGPLTHYALEAGRRLHVWPAPSADTSFAVLYTREMHPAILPDNRWEAIVLNGVLGMYGQHFDRDALTQNPEYFESRFYRQLVNASKDSWDVERASRFDDILPAESRLTANSSTDTAITSVVPASLTGIGFVTIETGDYLLEVA